MVENQSCTVNPLSDELAEHLPHRHLSLVPYAHVIHVIDDAVHFLPGLF